MCIVYTFFLHSHTHTHLGRQRILVTFLCVSDNLIKCCKTLTILWQIDEESDGAECVEVVGSDEIVAKSDLQIFEACKTASAAELYAIH